MSNIRSHLRLPPFGLILEAYCNSKVRLKQPIRIYLGTPSKEYAYHEMSFGIMCTYLPDNMDYKNIRWPVQNQNVIIYDTAKRDSQYATQLAFFLQDHYQPNTIAIQSESFPLQLITPAGVKHHG
jgi:hypothetical protein